MRRQVIAAALVGTLALVGCGVGSGREVTVEDLSLTVPSGWTEREEESRTIFASEDEESYVFVEFSADDYDTPPMDLIDQEKEILSLLDTGTVTDYEIGDELVIDGAPCYCFSTTEYDPSDEGFPTIETDEAYIYANGLAYHITVGGDELPLDKLLDTMSVAD